MLVFPIQRDDYLKRIIFLAKKFHSITTAAVIIFDNI